jgi:hypothetical protein
MPRARMLGAQAPQVCEQRAKVSPGYVGGPGHVVHGAASAQVVCIMLQDDVS